MESVTTSRRTFSNAPQQEFLMQGSIMDTHCEVLLHRLRGLCDNADEPPETFHDYEMVYQIRTSNIIVIYLFLIFNLKMKIQPVIAQILSYVG